MAEITPTVLFEDIAWGEGVVEVPTYGGSTRQGTKINLGNIPFNATKSVAEAMTEINNLLTSQDYAAVHNNLQSLIALKNNLQSLLDVRNQLNQVSEVHSELDTLRQIATRLPMLDNVEELISTINNYTTNLRHSLDSVTRSKECIRKDIEKAKQLVYDKLEPLTEAVVQARLQLDTIIATARADVIAGQEIIVKFATYSLEIQPKRFCFNPRLIIDDDNHKIIWQVPTVKGDCAVLTEIPPQLVQDAVDAYIGTLHIGGNEYKEKRMDTLPSITVKHYPDTGWYTLDAGIGNVNLSTNSALSDLDYRQFLVHVVTDAIGTNPVKLRVRFADEDTGTNDHKLIYTDENGTMQYATGNNSGAFKKGDTLLIRFSLGDDDLGGTNSFYLLEKFSAGSSSDEEVTANELNGG